jgi:hypothetical protein
MSKSKTTNTTQQVLDRQARDHTAGGIMTVPAGAIVTGNPWSQFSNALEPYVGITQRLKFSKQGEWMISDTETLPPGTRCMARTDLMSYGWNKFLDGKLVEQRTGKLADHFTPSSRNELGDTDQSQWELQPDGTRKDPWAFCSSLPLVLISSGEAFVFTSYSRGGLRALGQLASAYGRRVGHAPRSLPVVELKPDHYKHKLYGKIFVPLLHIVGWTDDDGRPLSTSTELADQIPF